MEQWWLLLKTKRYFPKRGPKCFWCPGPIQQIQTEPNALQNRFELEIDFDLLCYFRVINILCILFCIGFILSWDQLVKSKNVKIDSFCKKFCLFADATWFDILQSKSSMMFKLFKHDLSVQLSTLGATVIIFKFCIVSFTFCKMFFFTPPPPPHSRPLFWNVWGFYVREIWTIEDFCVWLEVKPAFVCAETFCKLLWGSLICLCKKS